MKRVGLVGWTVCGTALLLLPFLSLAAESPPPPPDNELDRVSEDLGRLVSAGAYADALPLARQLIVLLEEAGPDPRELASAYESLGALQLQTGDAPGAEASLLRALDLLAGTEGIASPRLISPLRQLAEVYREQRRPAAAAQALQRGIAISHRAFGLFNAGQLAMVEPLIGLYEQAGDQDGVDQELQHAVMIHERVYGDQDPRLLPLIERLARRYEQTDHLAAARQAWTRMVGISSREGGGRNEATITALLGIARSHRLQFVRDPRSMSVNTCRTDPETGELAPLMVCTELGRPLKLDEGGEKAALQALEILESAANPPPALLAAALLELGDWYITAHQPETAIPYYRRAWPILAEISTPGLPNPLLVPRPLDYRTPAAASRYDPPRGNGPTGSAIEFSLTVTADGETADVEAVSDAAGARLLRIRRALEKARFSPRFVDGQPVATEDYRFVEYWQEPGSSGSGEGTAERAEGSNPS